MMKIEDSNLLRLYLKAKAEESRVLGMQAHNDLLKAQGSQFGFYSEAAFRRSADVFEALVLAVPLG